MSDTQYDNDADRLGDWCEWCGERNYRCTCNLCDPSDALCDEVVSLRQSLTSLACYAATARQSNTPEWMQGLVEKLNNAAGTLDEPKTFVWHHIPATGECWITCEDKS